MPHTVSRFTTPVKNCRIPNYWPKHNFHESLLMHDKWQRLRKDCFVKKKHENWKHFLNILTTDRKFIEYNHYKNICFFFFKLCEIFSVIFIWEAFWIIPWKTLDKYFYWFCQKSYGENSDFFIWKVSLSNIHF